jgi:hypothetical protein
MSYRDGSSGADSWIRYRYDRIGNVLTKTSGLAHRVDGLELANVGAMVSGGTAGRFDRGASGATDPPGPHALTSTDNGTDIT